MRPLINKLIRTCGTNDPFRIAEMRNITVLYEYLGKTIWGYFSSVNRIPIIHLHDRLNVHEARFTCAHELGHAILHSKVNTPFLKKHTLQSIERIEREANEFAAELLISDELLMSGLSIYEAAAISGVPQEVAHLKTQPQPKKSFWSSEDSFYTIL